MTVRTEDWLDARPWFKEGMTKSAWLRRYRGAWNMVLQAMAAPAVMGMTPLQIAMFAYDRAVTAPPQIFAMAIDHVADHMAREPDADQRHVARLREAAAIAGRGKPEEPVPTAHLREALQAIVQPYESEQLPLADPLTGKPMAPQPEWAGRPPGHRFFAPK